MEALLNNLIKATGWSILHSLWQGAVIFGLLMPTQLKAFKLSAKVRYALAYTANCLIFLSFTLTFLTVFEWPAAQQIEQTAQVRPIISYPLFQAGYIEKLFPFLACLYSIGVVIQAIIMYRGYRKVQLIKRAAHLEIPQEWNVLFETLVVKMNISRKVKFYLSDHVNIPLIIGYLKPVVLFPVALVSQLDIAQTEAILIHELSHIRRNDYLFNIIRTMINTLLFFNPFVWLTGKFIAIEREHACDDLVVQLTDQPLKYAHALLKLELITDKSNPALALAATGKNQHLYHRIKRITDMKTNYMNSKQKLIAVSLTIATIFSLAWISPARKTNTVNSNTEILSKPNSSGFHTAVTDTGKKAVKKRIKTQSTGNSSVFSTTSPPAKEQIEIILKDDSVKTGKKTDDDSALTLNTRKAIADFAGSIQTLVLSDKEINEKIARLQKETESRAANLTLAFDSPEQRDKWNKLAEETKAKYNSPEGKERLKKLQTEVAVNALKAVKMANNLSFEEADLNNTRDNTPVRIYLKSPEITVDAKPDKIRQTPEYLKLKKKFDEDVANLEKKNTSK